MLSSAGCRKLSLGERWELAPGGKYYLTRGGSAVIAFRVPEGDARAFAITEDGALTEVDCCYPACVHAPACPIAAELRALETSKT